MGSADVDRVSAVFREALSSFMSRRKSPLTAQMFTDLFNRFPVSGADGAEVHSGSLWPDLTPRLLSFPGSVRGHVGRDGAAHNVRGQSSPAGNDCSRGNS